MSLLPHFDVRSNGHAQSTKMFPSQRLGPEVRSVVRARNLPQSCPPRSEHGLCPKCLDFDMPHLPQTFALKDPCWSRWHRVPTWDPAKPSDHAQATRVPDLRVSCCSERTGQPRHWSGRDLRNFSLPRESPQPRQGETRKYRPRPLTNSRSPVFRLGYPLAQPP